MTEPYYHQVQRWDANGFKRWGVDLYLTSFAQNIPAQVIYNQSIAIDDYGNTISLHYKPFTSLYYNTGFTRVHRLDVNGIRTFWDIKTYEFPSIVSIPGTTDVYIFDKNLRDDLVIGNKPFILRCRRCDINGVVIAQWEHEDDSPDIALSEMIRKGFFFYNGKCYACSTEKIYIIANNAILDTFPGRGVDVYIKDDVIYYSRTFEFFAYPIGGGFWPLIYWQSTNFNFATVWGNNEINHRLSRISRYSDLVVFAGGGVWNNKYRSKTGGYNQFYRFDGTLIFSIENDYTEVADIAISEFNGDVYIIATVKDTEIADHYINISDRYTADGVFVQRMVINDCYYSLPYMPWPSFYGDRTILNAVISPINGDVVYLCTTPRGDYIAPVQVEPDIGANNISTFIDPRFGTEYTIYCNVLGQARLQRRGLTGNAASVVDLAITPTGMSVKSPDILRTPTGKLRAIMENDDGDIIEFGSSDNGETWGD